VAAKIHVPDPDLGEAPPAAAVEESEDGANVPTPKKKTRRGTRGGRGRKKKTAAVAPTAVSKAAEAEPEESRGDWEYVPMSQWGDEIDKR
jgi:hypothetical protein